ncbi:MAG: hydroxyacylglutathione hydrolase [Burkholderiaceae bacterium]|jgi:hydroxyacylglutathione hydrolase|nr:hydroxyacylglutathione hydrolase [Betaproteobacteria bacterium]
MKITPLFAFSDNIIWAIESDDSLWVVDPGDAQPVLRWLSASGKSLTGVLITHHHQDHVGGLPALLAQAPWQDPMNPRILGPADCQAHGVNTVVVDGQDIPLANRSNTPAQLHVMAVPGHTLDHLAYLITPAPYEPGPQHLFCGDTLFAGGCGRLLGGTAEQLYHSLARLAQLPGDTGVYCAHEYTLSNLLFAAHVRPDCPHTRARLEQVRQIREQGGCTLPSTISLERQTNPFLLTDGPLAFAALRREKDSFRAPSR